MEKFGGHIDKIVNRNENSKNIMNLLFERGQVENNMEIKKTPRDKELIDFVQKCADEYLKELGKENIYEVDYSSIHVVPDGGVSKFTNDRYKDGVTSSEYGSFFVDRKQNDIDFSIVTFHELFHLKDFSSIQFKNNIYDIRRSGFKIYHYDRNKENNKIFFKKINETINDYFCKRFFEEKIKGSDLYDKEEVEKYKLSLPRIRLLDKFEEVSNDLFEKNKDQFKSKEEIKKLFFDADVNGNLLPVARLIEKTYGEGSFRKVGEKY